MSPKMCDGVNLLEGLLVALEDGMGIVHFSLVEIH